MNDFLSDVIQVNDFLSDVIHAKGLQNASVPKNSDFASNCHNFC